MPRRTEIAAGLFGAKPSRQDKADVTSSVARAIIDGEVQSRDAKTARLRALRLAQEAAVVATAKEKPAKKKAAKAK